jgi:hypothetical protein
MVSFGTYRNVPFRTEVDPTRQTVFFAAMEIPIPADSTATIPIVYTVPDGKVLILGYIKGSVDKDCIFSSIILKAGVPYCSMFHPQLSIINLSSISGFYFVAGEEIGIEVINPLAEVMTLRGDLGGFLYDAP